MLICSNDDAEGEQKVANATKEGAKARGIVRLAGWVDLRVLMLNILRSY